MTHIWHKLLAKRDVGHIWESSINGMYDFVYLVIIIVKSVVEGSLIIQRRLWGGSNEVRCKYWVWEGKVFRIGGFEIVLLGVQTWWGFWVQENFYCGSWIICFRKRSESGVWG